MLDDASRQQITDLGGIDAICMSHPHFYGAHIDYAEAFDARVLIPRADEQWIRRPSARIELFDDAIEPVTGLTLARIGGHFDGACVLHWPSGSDGRGALLTGDTITVVPDREWVSFMWSYPNLIPLDENTVRDIVARVEAFESTVSMVAGGAASSSTTARQRFADPPTATSPASTVTGPNPTPTTPDLATGHTRGQSWHDCSVRQAKQQ